MIDILLHILSNKYVVLNKMYKASGLKIKI